MANLQLIRTIANEQKISLEQLANEVGITIQAMLKIIRINSTKIETLERIANVLKVSPCVFFDDDAPKAIATEQSIAVSGYQNKVNSQADKFLALLAKKDEQIDKLLTLLKDKQ